MKITVKNFQKKIPVNPKRIKKAILKVFSSEGKRISGEISVCIVTDARIRKLNLRYKGQDSPTDVLAFDLGRDNLRNGIFADIVISADTAIRNAKVFNTSPSYETALYVTHGILHLLGYRDDTAVKRKLMRRKEERYVNT